MSWKQSIAMVGILASAITGCLASVPASVITADDVVAALHDRKVEVASGQIQFFVDVSRRELSPLEVMTIEPSTNGRSVVKLRCHERHACIPFYVGVRWTNATQQASALHAWRAQPDTRQAFIQPPRVKPAPLVIHAGEPATLVISGDQMQMQLPVQCLESGRAGSKIRVRSKDGKKLYRAEVVGPNSVRINM